jgi:hypothetical protein
MPRFLNLSSQTGQRLVPMTFSFQARPFYEKLRYRGGFYSPRCVLYDARKYIPDLTPQSVYRSWKKSAVW